MKSQHPGSTIAAKSSATRAPAPGANAAPQGNILKVSIEAACGGTLVLHCQNTGIFDPEARALSGFICDVLPTTRRMVVNLEGVQALDTAALGELVLTHMWADAAGYALTFAGPSDSVRGLFESTNLISVLDLYSSVDAALAAMYQQEVRSA